MSLGVPEASGEPRRQLAYMPALDGLRALSVLAVLAFHAGIDGMRGGYLPLTAFFVLSGFLITALLLLERDSTGGIDLRAFWGRRVRRLAPGALLGLGLVGAYVAFGARTRADGLVGDVVSSLTWVTNWRFIVEGRSYADAFADPSPLQHYWSLAVEEQFYVALPLLAAVLLFAGRGRRRWLAVACVALTVASVATMQLVHQPGDAPLRAYFGTDTRGAELLVGVLLAVVLVPRGRGLRRLGGRPRALVDVAGSLALGTSVWLWVVTPEYDDRLFAGGLLGVAVLAAAVVAAASQPSTWTARLLSLPPLVALGRVSYGVYLFHWPLFLWVDQERTGLDEWPLFALRLALVLPLAWLSHRHVEVPLRAARWEPRLAGVAWANGAVVVTAVVALAAAPLPHTGVSLTIEDRAAAQPAAASGSAPRSRPDPIQVPGPSPAAPEQPSDSEEPTPSRSHAARPADEVSSRPPAPTPTSDPPTSDSPAPAPSPAPPSTDPTPAASPPTPEAPLRVLVVGDSLAFNLATGLQRHQAAGGPVIVEDASIPGCPVIRDGIRHIDSGPWPIPEECRWWGTGAAARVTAFRPDVVLVNSSVNELFDLARPVWGEAPRSPGDPDYDRFVTDEWSALADALLGAGARVAWVTPTCVDFARYRPGYIEPAEGNRRADYFRTVLFPRLVAARAIEVVDLHRQVCPGDRYTTDVVGIPGGRPDGFHFTDAAAEVLARDWLLPHLRRLAG